MERPADLGETVPVSDASKCSIMLVLLYFAVYLGVQICDTLDKFMGWTSKATKALDMGKNTVCYAPMLAILFMAARMRAMQLNPPDGKPQDWARTSFYVATYSIIAQTLIAVLVPLLVEAKAQQTELEGEVVVEVENKPLAMILLVARWAIMAGTHVAIAVVIISIFTIEALEGPTAPISTTVGCVVCMTAQYFFVYIFLWVLFTMMQFGYPQLEYLKPILVAAKDTVTFAPMLSILFVGTRMRALQLSKNAGAPQSWVQNCMMLATMALLLQIVMVTMTGLLTSRPMPSSDPMQEKPNDGSIVGVVTAVAQYAGMFAMYGGASGVIVGLFKMTPENVGAVM